MDSPAWHSSARRGVASLLGVTGLVLVASTSACTQLSEASPTKVAVAAVTVRASPLTRLTPAQRTDLQATAEAAWRRVQAVWGLAPDQASAIRPRLEVVTGSGELARANGRTIGSTEGLVALTGADAVTVDSTAFFRLAPTGQRVLLTHEFTHLATDAAADPTVPIWFEEGFADYVGFGDSGIAEGAAALALIDQVRAGHWPKALPADDDFTQSGPQLAVAYQASWLFCRTLADRYGQAALVQVYRRVAHGGSTVPAAVEAVTGHSFAETILAWQARIATLAAVPRTTS